MRVVIDGPVTDEMMDTAELFGITPTLVVSMGLDPLPFLIVPTKVVWNKALDGRYELASLRRINHFYLLHGAQAAVIKGDREHLRHLVDLMGIPCYWEA